MSERMRELFDELKVIHGEVILLFKFGGIYTAYYEDEILLKRLYGGTFKDRITVPESEIANYCKKIDASGYVYKLLKEEDT